MRSRADVPARIWVIRAPAGVWTTGPTVCAFEDTAESYREMGWIVEGPYVLEASLASACKGLPNA